MLEAFQDGRLEVGEHTLLEPHVWLTAPAAARIRIGSGTFLNIGVMVAAVELVEIGDHCMFANGCFVSDGNHRFDDPDKPVPWQGFTTKGPDPRGRQRLVRRERGDHQRRDGRRALRDRGEQRGHRDLPPFSVAAGAPARVLRTIEYPSAWTRSDDPGAKAQQETIRWNGLSAVAVVSVRTRTPLTLPGIEPVACPGPARRRRSVADGRHVGAGRTSRSKIT